MPVRAAVSVRDRSVYGRPSGSDTGPALGAVGQHRTPDGRFGQREAPAMKVATM